MWAQRRRCFFALSGNGIALQWLSSHHTNRLAPCRRAMVYAEAGELALEVPCAPAVPEHWPECGSAPPLTPEGRIEEVGARQRHRCLYD